MKKSTPVITTSSFSCGGECCLASALSVVTPQNGVTDKDYIFDNVAKVRELARSYFKDGVVVEQGSYSTMARQTNQLIKGGVTTIYNASFFKFRLFASIHILRLDGKNVEIYLVKSSNKVKDTYFIELAFQAYLLEKCGYNIDKAYLMFVNGEFVKDGSIDPKEFFIIKDVSKDTFNLKNSIGQTISNIRLAINKTMNSGMKPAVGDYCFHPYKCPFWDQCLKKLPENSIFEIRGMRKAKQLELYYGTNTGQAVQTMAKFLEIVTDENPKFVQQADFTVNNRTDTTVQTKELAEFLNQIQYPIISLDFETVFPAIPLFKNQGPYAQDVTQFSMHVLEGPGKQLKHFEFLADPSKGDWRSELAHYLVKVCPSNGSILVWNQAMEKNRILDMAEDNPDIKEDLLNMVERIVDLMVPFKSRVIYNEKMKGYFSVKHVLPALCPGNPTLDYANLPINNGMLASIKFTEMMDGKLSEEEIAKTRKDLLTYCALDTYGPFKILEVMYHLLNKDAPPLFVDSTKKDSANVRPSIGSRVSTNVGIGTIVGFTPCFVRILLDKNNAKILRMSHNLLKLPKEFEVAKVPSGKIHLGTMVMVKYKKKPFLGKVISFSDRYANVLILTETFTVTVRRKATSLTYISQE